MFNVLISTKMSGDGDSAREYFKQSLEQSNNIGLREGVVEAKAAIRRLDRLQSSNQDGGATSPA